MVFEKDKIKNYKAFCDEMFRQTTFVLGIISNLTSAIHTMTKWQALK